MGPAPRCLAPGRRPALALVRALAPLCAAALLAAPAPPARAQDGDPCAGYQWDVSKERALFATQAEHVAAGKDGRTDAPVVPGRLLELMLLPLGQVSFPVPPGKASHAQGSYGGVFVLTIPSAGKYRIAIDQPAWIDIVADGRLVAPTDYEGVRDCHAPRKIVEFDLEGGHRWQMQLSAAERAAVRLTVTPVG
ncbi:MAG TPA: hypothetical protein VME42_11970 [Steroidobacteraceae bacterium]|nr:hypothetical protein [Steroidobacteraceae bacterium]